MKTAWRERGKVFWTRDGWLALPFLFLLWLLGASLQPIEGQIGHDYYHALPRLIIGAAHFWQNGWSLPHYTPSLCGGLPFFADPQNSYFSLPQVFTLFLDPFLASRLTILLCYLVGYGSSVRLFATVLGYPRPIAHLGALLFCTNGFTFAHLWVGHLTHHSSLFLPAVMIAWLSLKPGSFLPPALGLSCLLLYTFYSGGLHLLVVMAALSGLMIPMVLARGGRALLPALGAMILLTLVFFTLGASGKVLLARAYSAHFPAVAIDRSEENPLWIFLRYFWFNPYQTPLTLPFGRLSFGPWEYIGFLSRLTFLGALAFIFRRRPGKSTAVITLLLLALAALALGRAGNESLPFFRGYHNPIKLLAAFLPLLVWATLEGANHLYQAHVVGRAPRAQLGIYFLVTGVVVIEMAFNANFFIEQRVGLGFPYSEETYDRVKARHALPPVAGVTDLPGSDLLALGAGYTDRSCYEPLLGYRLENLRSTVQVGATAMVIANRFNLNQPACLLYPKAFHCRPWDRIPETDRENFERFREGRTPAWGVPAPLSWLLRFNLVFTAALTISGVVLIGRRKRAA